MTPEVQMCERRLKVRRTELAGSTGSFASGRQAHEVASRRVVVTFFSHDG